MTNPPSGPGPRDLSESAELEQQTRQLLYDAGARPRELSLTDAEQRRTSAAARAVLDDLLTRQERHHAPVRSHPSRNRWALVAVAAVIAGAVFPVSHLLSNNTSITVATTPPMAQFEDSGRQSSTSAADLLTELASAAAAQPGADPAPVQLVITEHWQLADHQATDNGVTVTRSESYLLPDGTIRVIDRQPQPLSESGQMTPDSLSNLTPVAHDTTRPTAGSDYPNALPTDPGALTTQLVPADEDCPRLAACLTQAIIGLHEDYVLSPSMIAALWNALAQTDDVTYLGQTQDRLGRPTVAIQVPSVDNDHDIVIYADRTNGAFFGSEKILTTDDPGRQLAAPTVISFTMIVASQRLPLSDVP